MPAPPSSPHGLTVGLVAPDGETRLLAEHYFAQCRARVPTFVQAHFSWAGARRLHRWALGWDLLVAPLNFLLGFPNFLLRIVALLLRVVGRPTTARRVGAWHLGFKNRVEGVLEQHLRVELFPAAAGLPDATEDSVTMGLREYLRARHAMADLTAGTIVLLLGFALFEQFTPGSVSAATVIAQAAEKQLAAQGFFLGDAVGSLYYNVFPPQVAGFTLLASFIGVGAAIAVITAFAGVVYDPIQAALGFHQRRLRRLIRTIEARVCNDSAAEYRPRSVYLARVYDVIDWIKGWLAL